VEQGSAQASWRLDDLVEVSRKGQERLGLVALAELEVDQRREKMHIASQTSTDLGRSRCEQRLGFRDGLAQVALLEQGLDSHESSLDPDRPEVVVSSGGVLDAIDDLQSQVDDAEGLRRVGFSAGPGMEQKLPGHERRRCPHESVEEGCRLLAGEQDIERLGNDAARRTSPRWPLLCRCSPMSSREGLSGGNTGSTGRGVQRQVPRPPAEALRELVELLVERRIRASPGHVSRLPGCGP
jgi:hypothetical protein